MNKDVSNDLAWVHDILSPAVSYPHETPGESLGTRPIATPVRFGWQMFSPTLVIAAFAAVRSPSELTQAKRKAARLDELTPDVIDAWRAAAVRSQKAVA